MTKKKKKIRRLAGHQKKKKPYAGQGTLQQAFTLHQAGRLAEAEALYRRLLQDNPDNPDALHLLGKLAQQVGKSRIAMELVSRSISLKPNNAEAHFNLGTALHSLGKTEEAAASYYKAVDLKPDYIEANYNLGILLHILGKQGEAESALRKVLARKPGFVGAHNNLGLILQAQGKFDEAEASYRKALDLKPDFADACNNLGNVLHLQNRPREAEASYRRALAIRPDYVEARTNLGIELQSQGRLYEAEDCYRKALSLRPDYVDARNNLGMVLQDLGRLDEAIAGYRQVLKLAPDFAQARSNLLLCLNYHPHRSPADYLDEARNYGRQVAGRVGARFSDWICRTEPERLRIGMVSGDFRLHSVGYFLENLLSNIDFNSIELVAFPISRTEDELTARIRSRFISWEPITGLSDEAAAQLVHDAGVHILLDLSGHTSPSRLPVFAWKPAPVQVSWLGYSASTGLQEMDYLLADPYVVPVDEEECFTETIWRLPESYLCFSPPLENVKTGPLPALKNAGIVFGSFNNPTKMNDTVAALWARILQEVPGSKLLLKSKRFSDQKFCDTIRHRFLSRNIAPDRLLLQGYASSREEHLATYNKVDIALDPFPYNGTTTSVEALWMGVPFITLRGDRFVSHVGESIAHNSGMNDWIADNPEDYVLKAKAKTADLKGLSEMRAVLRRRLLASPLLDGLRFAGQFEKAMWGMWRAFNGKS